MNRRAFLKAIGLAIAAPGAVLGAAPPKAKYVHYLCDTVNPHPEPLTRQDREKLIAEGSIPGEIIPAHLTKRPGDTIVFSKFERWNVGSLSAWVRETAKRDAVELEKYMSKAFPTRPLSTGYAQNET